MTAFRWAIACIACGLGISAAHADVKLQNKDSKAHDITVKATGAKMSGSGDATLVIEKPKK